MTSSSIFDRIAGRALSLIRVQRRMIESSVTDLSKASAHLLMIRIITYIKLIFSETSHEETKILDMDTRVYPFC